MSQPYTVFRRKTRRKKRFIYYAQFRDADGRRMTAVSTGKTTKAEALAWAQAQHAAGLAGRKRCPRLAQFAENWFLWDRCDYLARKRERGAYSRSYADYQRSKLVHHIIPSLGHKRLDELTATDVERWLVQTKRGSTAANANRVLVVLKIMLKEAVRQGLIPVSPAETVEGLPEVSVQKGTLLLAEVKSLFGEDSLEKAWGGRRFHQVLNALALTTGMRMGEIQALRWKDVQGDHVCVEHSWDRSYGLKRPKANSNRVVPLAATVARWLEELHPDTEHCDSEVMVFHGQNLYRPIDHKAIGKHFQHALVLIGIGEEEQRLRNLTFHSWRHTFHALMRGSMSDTDLRRISGHRSERMTEHYDHVTVDLMRRVSPLIEQALIRPSGPCSGAPGDLAVETGCHRPVGSVD